MPTDTKVTLHVCTTCKIAPLPGSATAASEPRGQALYDRLLDTIASQGLADRVNLQPVECLSVCKRAATVAVSGTGRWTYVYGDIEPDRDLDTLIAGILAYAEAPAGLIPWKERPQIFKKGVVARIPSVLGIAPGASI